MPQLRIVHLQWHIARHNTDSTWIYHSEVRSTFLPVQFFHEHSRVCYRNLLPSIPLLNLIQILFKVLYYIGWIEQLYTFAEAAEPSEELLTYLNICGY